MSEAKHKLAVRINGTMTGRGPEIYIPGAHYDDGSELVVAECGTTEVSPRGNGNWRKTHDAKTLMAYVSLFVAAPDLLGALKEITAFNEERFSEGPILKNCRAAIAQAEARS